MSGGSFVVLCLALVAAVLLVAWSREHRTVVRERSRTSRERVALTNALAELEAAQRTSQHHLDGLGEAALDVLLVVDANRHIVWGNQTAWDLFGQGKSGVGQTFIELVRDYELNQTVADTLAGHRAMVRQTAFNERTLRIHVVPIEDGGGAAVAVEDVTELQRLGRARRDFVANISHELRTPLANIDLAAQTLSSGDAHDRGLRQRMLDQIHTQVEALSQLSQEMMDLAQIESGRVLLKLMPCPVEPIVRRAVGLLGPQAALKNQHVSVVVPPDLVALVDEQQVVRVIRNLVHNAIKFTPEGGIIGVYADAYGEEDVRICVSDTGPGIPEAEQERIFERFYKQDRARSKGGTGLGLAIARHIAEGHGGRIWVESSPGHGATFCFTVPRG